MATQAQIEAALQIQGTYSLITGAASFTDITNYAGLGITSPDTVKIVLWIQDSTTATLYKNAGYDTANFGVPDLEPIAGDATYSFTLPTVAGGAYLTGQYTVNMKVQVVEGSDTVNAFKSLYQNINATCNGIVASVAPNVTYNTAVVSVTDNTSYGAYTALTNTLTLYPPPPSGQSSQQLVATGTPATLIYQPSPGTYPYTGTWTWTLSSDVTYTDYTGASTTCRIPSQGSFEVIQSQLCKVYCILKEARGEVLQHMAQRQTYAQQELDSLVRAEGEYMLAWAASLCGKPQSEIDVYINNIYSLINKSPDCNCGCNDGTSQPLVPTSIINGTNGTDGSQIYSGSGVPSNSLGVVNDYYIDVATSNLYKKTGASTWTFLIALMGATGATGATGAAGAAGADGVAILANQFPDLATLGTSFESLLVGRTPYVLPAATLTADGDEIHIRTVFISTVATSLFGQTVRLTFNGNNIRGTAYTGFYASNIREIVIDARITRTSNTTAKSEVVVEYFTGETSSTTNNSVLRTIDVVTTIAGLNFTTTAYNIDAQGDSVAIGDINCQAFEVINYKI